MPRKKESVASVGKTIKKVRMDKKYSLEQVANDTGCSVDYLKDIESGKVIPPVGSLLTIARALHIDSGMLFREQEDVMEKRVSAYTKRTDNYAYTTLTPGAENKHIKAFRVVVEAKEEHGGVGYQHEGEEFIYVLKGKIEVVVGDHVNTVGEGESLHFNSAIRHQLRNVGSTEAEFIDVIYTP